MSRTSERVGWIPGRLFIWVFALFTALPVRASVDQPDMTEFFANGWHESGWLSHGVQLNVESGKSVFDNVQDMVFSPHYAKPIRKVILETKCTAGSLPKRFLTVWPYVAGVEDPSRQFVFEVVENWGELTVLSLDFAPEDKIDAIRIGLSGSENANWILSRLAVVYGEKTEDDDKVVREFAQQLPVPENLTLTGLTSSSLSLSASNVADAVNYCFELTKLTGCPRTELREDFVAVPELSNGWTYDTRTEGLTLSDGGKTYSDSTTGDEHALKIEKATNPKEGPVELGLVSPLSSEPISKWSFVGRVGALEKSNSFAVYGRVADTSTEWIELARNLTPDKKTSNKLFSGTVDVVQNIHQVRFVLTADANSWTTTGLDSLRVVYGGNEERELISTTTNETPEAAWQDLASGRYGYRVKALGATEGENQFKDSAWSEEQTVDLAWADISLSPPENLVYEMSGDKLNLSWSPVAMADHYIVKVALADDPENPVATLTTKSTSASVTIAELGDYVVTVTAVSPGGVSTASSSRENCTVALGKVTELEVEATSADTIAAKWKSVPLAESYQAKLFKVTGEAGTEVSDYSKLPEGVWPVGWEHDANWLSENLTTSGPKFTYDGEVVLTKLLSLGITRVTFAVKSNSSSADKLANQHLQVEAYSEKEGNWSVCTDVEVASTSQTTVELSFEIAEDVRRLRFTALTWNRNYQPAILLGKVSVSYGEYVRTEVASVGTKECAATYRDLDRTAKYVVVVTPQPSEGTECEASSEIIDLASEYFRPVGPVSIAGCKGGVYLQNFDSLTNVTKETDLKRVPLENWQFFKGSGEAEKLFYTYGTNSTKGGVYCYSDEQRTTDSFMIGTVATKDLGSSIGLAFVNDTGSSLNAPTLTFTAIRRNGKPGEPYQLEWIVTDGPWSIGTESDRWKSLPLTENEPNFSVTPDCRLAPRQVIIFRWRQEKVSGGPMLGLDDILVEFPVDKPGFMIHLR